MMHSTNSLLGKRNVCFHLISNLWIKLLLVLLLCIFLGVGIPFLLSKYGTKIQHGARSCDLERSLRIDCFPGTFFYSKTKENCEAAGCCWDNSQSYCYHSHPSTYVYKLISKNVSEEGVMDILLLSALNKTVMGEALSETARIRIEYLSSHHLEIIIGNNSKFSCFEYLDFNHRVRKENVSYEIIVIDEPYFHLKVYRKNSRNIPIFNTFHGPLIISEGLTELTSLLPSFNLYGIGQTPKNTFRHNLKTTKRVLLFSREEFKNESQPVEYFTSGVHPFYLVMDSDGRSHGVLLLNTSPISIITSGAPAITFRTAESFLRFHIFLGPTPRDVIRQLTEYVGKPSMPPFWSLGYHSCRETDSLNDVVSFLNFTIKENIPHESDCGSSQLLNSAFTANSKISHDFLSFYEFLKSTNRKFILFQNSQAQFSGDINCSTELLDNIYATSNLPRKLVTGFLPNSLEVTYPDFFSDRIISWLQKSFKKLSKTYKFDGLFFQRNTPVNFSTSKETTCSTNNDMKGSSYLLWNNLSIGTLNMAAMHNNNIPHAFLHNIYGYKQTLRIKSSLDSISHFVRRRKFLSSASTFIGSGSYSSSWSGLVSGSWKSLKQSVIQMLDFSLFGMPLNGIPVCGTSGAIDIELCSRWLQYAAFQPLLITHRMDGNELFLHNPRLASVARNMIGLRYSLLPYLYTLFYYSAKYGDTVVRPLFFEFPNVTQTYANDEQFLWGPALLVSPILQPSVSEIRVFFPPGCWYDMYTGKMIQSMSGHYQSIMVFDQIPLYIRGGQIIPSQPSDLTTESIRTKGYIFTAAFDCYNFNNENTNNYLRTWAYGELYIDDGISEDSIRNDNYLLVAIRVKGKNITINPKIDGLKTLHDIRVGSTILNTFYLFGIFDKPSNFFIDYFWCDHTYSSALRAVILKDINLDLHVSHFIYWD